MPPTSNESRKPKAENRRVLMARANALKPLVTVGKAGVTDAVIAQIRALLERTDLLKVRLPRGDGDEADEQARAIAERTPCEFVRRTGFVATFWREREQQSV